jgi:hypothetical protein
MPEAYEWRDIGQDDRQELSNINGLSQDIRSIPSATPASRNPRAGKIPNGLAAAPRLSCDTGVAEDTLLYTCSFLVDLTLGSRGRGWRLVPTVASLA